MYHIERIQEFLTEGDCFPLYMEISPVGICNHRCMFCAYDFIGYPNRKLETNRFLSFLDEIKEAGIKSLLYAGEGEPLLHPDIDKFIIHSKNNGIDVGLFTNGQFLCEELAKMILPSLTFLRFSFNGGTKENYAQIHNVKPKVFKIVVANIKRAVAIKKKNTLNVDIGIQYVLLSENREYLLDAVKTVRDAGVNYFVIKPFVQQSLLQSYHMKEQFDLQTIKNLLDKAEGLSDNTFKVIARKDAFKGYGKRGYKHCYGTSFISVLNSAGKLGTCLPYWDKEGFVYGDIYENSFKYIWSKNRRSEIKGYLEKKMDAHTCPPNCRPNSINEFLWEIKYPSTKHINFV